MAFKSLVKIVCAANCSFHHSHNFITMSAEIEEKLESMEIQDDDVRIFSLCCCLMDTTTACRQLSKKTASKKTRILHLFFIFSLSRKHTAQQQPGNDHSFANLLDTTTFSPLALVQSSLCITIARL